VEPKNQTDDPVGGSLFAKTAPLPLIKLDDEGRLACVRLIRSLNVGPTTFRELINHFGGAKQALDALPHITRQRSGAKQIKICPMDEAKAELETAKKVGAKPVFTIEPGYPPALANLPVPPPLVYTLGNENLLNDPAIAIVGARLASAAGIKLSRIFSEKLSRSGLVIVSGLARGIDKAAHEAAVNTRTIAVVAGGVDVIYPPEHGDLHKKIVEKGCLVSEMPCGFKPRAKDFPRRNSLISGLSLGVLVVEAARRSGSLVTARQAGEQNRELFAIPGHPLDPRAQGTNDLLKNSGALLVTEPDDILEALRPLAGPAKNEFRESQPFPLQTLKPEHSDMPEPDIEGDDLKNEPPTIAPEPAQPSKARIIPTRPQSNSVESHTEQIQRTLSTAPIDMDAISRATGLGTNHVRAALLELELEGRIERHGANLVSLKPATKTSD